MSDKNDDKSSPNSGTLSLGKTLAEVNKAAEYKKPRNRTIVETKRRKLRTETAQPIIKKEVKTEVKHVIEELVEVSKLTKEEKLLRQKVLEDSKKNSNFNEPSFDNTNDVTRFNIIERQSFIPEKKIVAVENNSYIKETTTAVPIIVEEEDEIEAYNKKKNKKELITEKKKPQNVQQWKSMYNYVLDKETDDDLETENTRVHFVQRRRKKNKHLLFKKEKIIKEVRLTSAITVEELANKMSEKSFVVLKTLIKLGIKAGLDTPIDVDTAELLVNELGHRAKVIKSTVEEIFYTEDGPADLQIIPPIVTIMGHVDHGKTSLLDTIRKSSVTSKEAGGITQHIGAYQISTSHGAKITFLDTPGHEAFGQIRARGSKVTDIVILVVAADDGVKTQTIEAISHAQAAKVPIIVAINKIDKPEANILKIKTDLMQHNIIVEDMGGDIQIVEVSAKTGMGIDKLLEAILLQAEILDLKANYNRKAQGVIIEVKVEKGKGFVATVILKKGKVHIGDIFISGIISGKVRNIIDDKGVKLKQATPSLPVEITGFSDIPVAGDDFSVVDNEKQSHEIIQYRINNLKEQQTNNQKKQNIEHLFSNFSSNQKMLAVIVKTDVHGSMEAIVTALNKIISEHVVIKIIHSSIGAITESDILLAKTAKAIIFGFNIRANNNARDLAKKEAVDIRYHSVIYNLIDDAKTCLAGMLDPDIIENILGYAEVRQVINITKVGKIAGCYVTERLIKKAAFVRLLRDSVVIYQGTLTQLKRFKDDVKEVKQGFECGVSFDNFHEFFEKDIIECFEKTEVKKEIK